MQSQVFVQPRTGREPLWYFEIYRGSTQGPAEYGQLFDFEAVVDKVRANARDGVIVRVIGPRDATQEQLDQLREIGAHPTFPT